MAANARESVLQGARLFVIAATGLAAAKVLVESGASIIKPALPYATVRALGDSRQVGMDQLLLTNGAPSTEHVVGHRAATVTVTFFGTEAADYAELTRMALESPSARLVTETAGYSVSVARVLMPRGSTMLLGTGFEARCSLDLEVAYRVTTLDIETPVARYLTINVTLDSAAPAGDLAFQVNAPDELSHLTSGYVDSGSAYPWNVTSGSSLTVETDLGSVAISITGAAAQLVPNPASFPWNVTGAPAKSLGLTVNGTALSPVFWDATYGQPSMNAVNVQAVAAFVQHNFPKIRATTPYSTSSMRVSTERLGTAAALVATGTCAGLFSVASAVGTGNVPDLSVVVPANLAAVASGWNAALAAIGVTASISSGKLRLTRSEPGVAYWVQVQAGTLATLLGLDSTKHYGT